MSISTADNTLRGARDLQVIDGSRTVRGFVGKADRRDFYRFSLQRSSDLNVSLDRLKANANLALLNAGGQILGTSNRKGRTPETISAGLEAGVYYIRVNQRKGDTRYRLRLTATPSPEPIPTPPDGAIPGDTLPTALNLGILTATRTQQETIGESNPVDLYKFSLNQISEFNASLSELTVATDLNLIWDKNGNGLIDDNERLMTGYASPLGSNPVTMTLAQGTYFVEVRTLSDRVSPYELTLSATPQSSNIPVDPGSSLKTAHNAGIATGSYTARELIGITDPTDYYKFTLNKVSEVKATLSGLSHSVDMALIFDANNNGLIDEGERLAYGNGSIYGGIPLTKTLPQGTYFIEVKSSHKFNNTLYNLTLTTTPKPSNMLIDPGDTLAKSHNLGTLTSSLVAHDLVGGIDKLDYYKFTVQQSTALRASLSGTSDAVYLSLIRDFNGNGVIDGNERLAYGSASPTWNEPILRSIAPGTYFIEVLSYAKFDNTAYTLTLST
ncbi:PPC domain-containing protein [Egbenema bharatensis]|uniref:PPC domain-containing protein n=1 Tax=Egbenema bharatensis TaxID=3463334 RepID=UPI003A8AB22F